MSEEKLKEEVVIDPKANRVYIRSFGFDFNDDVSESFVQGTLFGIRGGGLNVEGFIGETAYDSIEGLFALKQWNDVVKKRFIDKVTAMVNK